MSFLSRLADRMVLQPSVHPIETENRRVWIATATEKVEAWTLNNRRDEFRSESTDLLQQFPPDADLPQQGLVLLKFPGTAGRAERSGLHPANGFCNETEVWTINHRGWGASPGPASLQNFAETADAVWDHIKSAFPDRKVIVYGNSLGCLSALYLAATQSVDGLYLRNPPPLKPLIATRPRYRLPSLGFSALVAGQIPDQLDAIENARRCRCPALLVTSACDSVVPPKYQQMIFTVYGATKRIFTLADAGHASPCPDDQQVDYLHAIRWLEKETLASLQAG